MTELEIIVPIVAAILGVAYPIILQTVSTLDERYNTSDIAFFFKKEIGYRLFKYLLYIDLAVLSLYLANHLCNFLITKWIDVVIFVLIIFTNALVISFFFLIRKLLIYYSKEKLIQYIIKRDKKARRIGEYKYFITLTDIFCWSIRNEIDKIPETLNEYFYSCFRK